MPVCLKIFFPLTTSPPGLSLVAISKRQPVSQRATLMLHAILGFFFDGQYHDDYFIEREADIMASPMQFRARDMTIGA